MNKKSIGIGAMVLALGVAWHMAALAIVDRTVKTYPSVDDLLLRALPRLNLFGIGEIAFYLFLAAFAFAFFTDPRRDLGRLLLALGLFYGIRGFFLLLFPIGPPLDAVQTADRFALYPYASHAFFPGGHIGIMLLMIFSLTRPRIRLALFIVAALFAFGSLLTRAHYTADLLGGALLAWGIWTMVRGSSPAEKSHAQ